MTEEPEDALLTGGERIAVGDFTWAPWRPEVLAQRLADVEAPWAVAGGWAVDLWLERETREHESLRRPIAEVVRRSSDGIPFVAPEIVLLFKAKAARPKDEADAALVLPTLDAAQRSWLAAALDVVHPGHPWRSGL